MGDAFAGGVEGGDQGLQVVGAGAVVGDAGANNGLAAGEPCGGNPA